LGIKVNQNSLPLVEGSWAYNGAKDNSINKYMTNFILISSLGLIVIECYYTLFIVKVTSYAYLIPNIILIFSNFAKYKNNLQILIFEYS